MYLARSGPRDDASPGALGASPVATQLPAASCIMFAPEVDSRRSTTSAASDQLLLLLPPPGQAAGVDSCNGNAAAFQPDTDRPEDEGKASSLTRECFSLIRAEPPVHAKPTHCLYVIAQSWGGGC